MDEVVILLIDQSYADDLAILNKKNTQELCPSSKNGEIGRE